jgi:hypothetical protein
VLLESSFEHMAAAAPINNREESLGIREASLPARASARCDDARHQAELVLAGGQTDAVFNARLSQLFSVGADRDWWCVV